MALATCRDCGNEVSTSAKTCPKCGRPVPTRTFTTAAGCLIAIFAAGIIGSLAQSTSSSGTSATSGTDARPPIVLPASVESTRASAGPSASEQKRLTAAMKRTVDDVEHVTWYEPVGKHARLDYAPGFAAYPYVGQDSTGTWLRFALATHTDEWLFWDAVKASVDGTTIELPVIKSDKTDHVGNGVWEYYDQRVTPDLAAALERIAAGKNVKIRFAGEYYHDFTLGDADKRRIRDAVAFYRWKSQGNP